MNKSQCIIAMKSLKRLGNSLRNTNCSYYENIIDAKQVTDYYIHTNLSNSKHTWKRIEKTHFECEPHSWHIYDSNIISKSIFFSCQMWFLPYKRFTMLKRWDFIHLTWHIYLPIKLTDMVKNVLLMKCLFFNN